MKINSRGRGTEIPHKTQRVFLSFDPKNIDDLEKLTSDILDMEYGMDCAVCWLDKPGEDIDNEHLYNVLFHETQLLVLWVTVELLQSLSAGYTPVELKIARELNIPVLPIAIDGGFLIVWPSLGSKRRSYTALQGLIANTNQNSKSSLITFSRQGSLETRSNPRHFLRICLSATVKMT